MLIREILDSTRSWENLRGNDIDAIFGKLQAGYDKQRLMLETAAALSKTLSKSQWAKIKEMLVNDLSAIEKDTNEY